MRCTLLFAAFGFALSNTISFDYVPIAPICPQAYMSEMFPSAERDPNSLPFRHVTTYNVDTKRIQQALNAGMLPENIETGTYFPIYQTSDDSTTYRVALEFAEAGTSQPCELYIGHNLVVSKKNPSLPGMYLKQRRGILTLTLHPVTFRTKIETGSIILLYVPPGVKLTLIHGQRDIVSGGKDDTPTTIPLFSKPIEIQERFDDKANYGQSPKAPILSLIETERLLPSLNPSRQTNIAAHFESDAPAPFPLDKYLTILVTNARRFENTPENFSFEFESSSARCRVGLFISISGRPIWLHHEFRIGSSIQVPVHFFDQELPTGSKVLLFAPSTCGQVSIRKIRRKIFHTNFSLDK